MTYDNIVEKESRLIITDLYLSNERTKTSYDLSGISLSISPTSGDNSGVSCNVTVMSQQVDQYNEDLSRRSYKAAVRKLDDKVIDQDLFTVGDEVKVSMTYLSPDASSDSPVAWNYTFIHGRIRAVSSSRASYTNAALVSTVIAIGTDWDFLNCIPPANLYQLLPNNYRNAVKNANVALRRLNMYTAMRTTAYSSDALNIAGLTAIALDNSDKLKDLADIDSKKPIKYEEGKLSSLIDIKAAPKLKTIGEYDQSANAVTQYIIESLSRGIMTTSFKTLFIGMLGSFYQMAVPRLNDTDSGDWKTAVIPNNLLDDPVDLEIPVNGKTLSTLNAKTVLGINTGYAGSGGSPVSAVGIRYADATKGGTELGSEIAVYGEGVDKKLTLITAYEQHAKNSVIDANGNVVFPLNTIVIQNMPAWLRYTYFASKTEDVKDKKKRDKAWAEYLAKLSFAMLDRRSCRTSVSLPVGYFKQCINLVGCCIAVTASSTDLKDKTANENTDSWGSDILIGRVESVSMVLSFTGESFNGSLQLTLQGVHTAKEHEVLRTTSDELFDIQDTESNLKKIDVFKSTGGA